MDYSFAETNDEVKKLQILRKNAIEILKDKPWQQRMNSKELLELLEQGIIDLITYDPRFNWEYDPKTETRKVWVTIL